MSAGPCNTTASEANSDVIAMPDLVGNQNQKALNENGQERRTFSEENLIQKCPFPPIKPSFSAKNSSSVQWFNRFPCQVFIAFIA